MKKISCITLLLAFIFVLSIPAYAYQSQTSYDAKQANSVGETKLTNDKNIRDNVIIQKKDQQFKKGIKIKDEKASKLETELLMSTLAETEPNNDPNNATYITLDSWNEGNIGSSSDEDWYYFYTGSNGKTTVIMDNIPPGCDYDMYLYKLEGSYLYHKASSYYSGNHYENLSWVGQAGYYFVRVVTYEGYNPNSNYRLYAHLSTSYDSYEPNDNILTPTTVNIPGNYNYTVTADNQYDHDWYKISLSGSDWYKIAVDVVNLPNDYDAYLYDANGNLIGSSFESGTTAETIVMHVNTPGDYHVLVKPYGWNSPSATYTVKISVNAIYSGFWMGNPLSNYRINAGYLYGEWDAANMNTAHKGVDSSGTTAGEQVYAVAAGEVIQAKYSSGWGNNVVVRHTDSQGRTIYTRYAHLQSHAFGSDIIYGTNPPVPVALEGVIGYAGNSGTTAVHLHFSTEYNWQMTNGKGVLNPEYFLSRSVSNYGSFEGVVKNYNGDIPRPLTYNDTNVCRISGFTKDDPKFGARYTYGVMNEGTPFYDEEYFGMNYMTGRITPNTYTVNYTNPNYLSGSESIAFSSNTIIISNHVLDANQGMMSIGSFSDTETVASSSASLEPIGRFSGESGLEIALPTNGVLYEGDPAVYESYPIVKTQDGEKELKQFKVWYRPDGNESLLAEPFVFTDAGEALFVHRSYPNELYKIEKEGNAVKLNLPFAEIWDMKVNPINGEIAVYGSLADNPGALGIYLLNQSNGIVKEVTQYTVEQDMVFDAVIANLDYDKEGNLYFDQSPTDIPDIYCFDGKKISLIKKGAFTPKVSTNGELLAFMNCDNRNPRFSQEPITIEVRKIKANQSLGKLQAWGAIKWENDSQIIDVRGPAISRKIKVSDSGLSHIK